MKSSNKGKRLSVIGGIGIIVSIVFAFIPLLITIIAGLIANGFGCRLDESGSYPCMVGSVDIGGALSLLGLIGWLSLITFPIGALGVLIFGGVAIVGGVWYFVARRAARSETDASGA